MSTHMHPVPQEIWLVGISTGHSVAPPLHNYIARQLGLPWTYSTKEFVSLETCVTHLKSSSCAGAAVTMPWKMTILPYLDEIDESAQHLQACNTVASDPSGRLAGSNTDWRGIAGALKEGLSRQEHPGGENTKTGLIIGAGGAARAAVYAIWRELDCKEIFILNRDEQEVIDLIDDVQHQYTSPPPSITHVKTFEHATSIRTPSYAVGTVPDFEPTTPEEQSVKEMLAQIMSAPVKGILVDMCYKPRRTRHIQIAEKAGWQVVEGWRVVGHQAEYQWRGWAGEERIQGMEKLKDGIWRTLWETAEQSPEINF